MAAMNSVIPIYLKSVRCGALAVCVTGSMLLPAAAWAHGAEEHAGQMKKAGQTTGVGTDDYTRTVKTYVAPDVVLIDADDRPVRLRELLAGHDPVMMNFVFTTCSTICPVMTKVFSAVPARLGGEAKYLRMISISIDPENDTPLQLKAYAKSFQAGERWKFLTGRTQDIKAVQLAFDSYRGDKMSHEPLTLMRQAPGKPWVRIDGFLSPDQLVREYRKLLQP
jgi:protein SCO1/2